MRKTLKYAKIKAIYKKEMIDLLRDKKTLIMMIIVPLLLYPLIMMGSMLFSSFIASNIQESEYHIAIIDSDADESLGSYDSKSFHEFITNTEDELEYHLVIDNVGNNCEQALIDGEIDAYVEISAQDTENGRKNVFTVYYLSSAAASQTTSNMIKDKLLEYSKQTSREMLLELGLEPDLLLNPIETEFKDKSANEERVGRLLGTILPMLMVTSILLGAFYPAVDTTAGEKERGTLETLLTLPIGNGELITGKFLAVSTVAVASAILNLLSMLFMSLYMYFMIESDSTQELEVNFVHFIPAILILLLCVVSFALFISAITMCVTTFAKSFKEANNYVTPLMLVVMFATFVTFVPDIEFSSLLAAIPVVNISLLISNILVFKYNFALIMIVLVTNIVYAALSILLLVHLYNSEELMFGEGGTNLQIFTGRKELKKGGVPTLSDAVLVLSITLLLFLYIGSIVQAKFLLWGLFMTQLIILSIPVFAAWYTKKDFKQTFSMNLPKPLWVLGALFAEIGGFALMFLLAVLLSLLFPQDTETVNETMSKIIEGFGFIPTLLVIALSPAICEEALFRGYFFSASQKRLKPMTAILLGAVVFGIYHLSFVKFFTTGLLGLLFCYVVYETKSIFLTSMMHFINNAIGVLSMLYPMQLGRIFPVLFKQRLSIIEVFALLLVGVILLVIGIILLRSGKKDKSQREKYF